MYDEKQQMVYDTLVELDTKQALRVILNWHGWELFDDNFFQFLIDEGYIEEQYSDDYEDEEDEEDEEDI